MESPRGHREIIPFPESVMAGAQAVPREAMERIYKEIRTPHKQGIILRPEEGEMIDCPSVFRHENRWYMMFAAISGNTGYETHLAVSDNLLAWNRLGRILSFRKSGWDQWQADGGVALFDHVWGGSAELQRWDGRYWMTYIGGGKQGYETDPLSIGVASSKRPSVAAEWTRHEGNPVLHIGQPDVRPFEKSTLYKSHVIWDREERFGHAFIMYYNGKDARGYGCEAIGMALSDDMTTWHRFGDDWVLYNEKKSAKAISGDPQITRIGDLWVMFYFGAFWGPGAFDTFACSYDLVNWTKWEGPNLIEPSESYDEQYAHKPWIIKQDNIVYHFYCAVGCEGRAIALATSRDIQAHEKADLTEFDSKIHRSASL